MTNDQVKLIEQIYRTEGPDEGMIVSKFRLTLDENMAYDSFRSWVYFDEENNNVECIRTNSDHYTQVKYPLTICSSGFDNIICMEAYCNMSNFEQALTALCPGMDDSIKENIINWAKRQVGNIHNLAPIRERPYYKKDAIIQGAVYEPKVRPDLGPGDVVYDQGGFDNI